MKKIVLVLWLAIFVSKFANAQFELSVIGGPSGATFGGSDAKAWGAADSDPQFILRYAIGLVFAKEITERLYARLGLQYGAKGTTYKGTSEVFGNNGNFATVDIQYTKHLSYIDLPFMIQYYLLHEKLSLLAGLQPSLLLGISIETVRFHIKNIYQRLEVHSKIEVVSKSFKGEI